MPRTVNSNMLDMFTYLLVDYLIPYLIKFNIHPNFITIIGFIPIYYIYINIIARKKLIVYLFAFINYTLDCLDGELARKSGKTSKIGGILDSIHDVTSFFSLLYLIFNYLAIPIIIIFVILVIKIFKMDPIKHTAEKNKVIFNFVHDNLNLFYFIAIYLTYIYINK